MGRKRITPKSPAKPKKPIKAQIEFLRKYVNSRVFRGNVRVRQQKALGAWPPKETK
ncbi:MAG: hypothetical protein WCW13_01455 [archaeon]|jgi:hypothetical protein